MNLQDSLFFKDKLWKLLSFLEENQNGEVPSEELFKFTSISQDDFPQYISFLGHFDIVVDWNQEKERVHIGEMKKVSFELSMSEWISLQGHFPLLEAFVGKPFNNLLKEKFEMIEKENESSSLYNALSIENEIMESLKEDSSSFAAVLEEIIQSKKVAELTLEGGKTVDVYPHKLVHLDGTLNVVGEDVGDGCLLHLTLDSVQSVYERELEDYSLKYSLIEINDFIQAMRTVSGSEERLVLKIQDREDCQFETGYHFMADPYITSNMDGELIWAASVEVSDELYEWLYQLGEKIEILDPSSIKDGYEEFCQQKFSSKQAA